MRLHARCASWNGTGLATPQDPPSISRHIDERAPLGRGSPSREQCNRRPRRGQLDSAYVGSESERADHEPPASPMARAPAPVAGRAEDDGDARAIAAPQPASTASTIAWNTTEKRPKNGAYRIAGDVRRVYQRSLRFEPPPRRHDIRTGYNHPALVEATSSSLLFTESWSGRGRLWFSRDAIDVLRTGRTGQCWARRRLAGCSLPRPRFYAATISGTRHSICSCTS